MRIYWQDVMLSACSHCVFRGRLLPVWSQAIPTILFYVRYLPPRKSLLMPQDSLPIRWKNSIAWYPVCCINTATVRYCW